MQPDPGSYPDARTPWEDETWRRDALSWMEAGLAELGIRETGPRRVRLRPWSVIVRIEAAEPVWFKANPPGSAFEPALSARLAQLVPEHVLTPYAVEVERGWSLLPHGGQVLKEVEREPRHWAELLSQYAEFQRALIDHTDEFDRLGVPNGRLALLPEIFDQLLEGNPDERLHKLRPELVDWCAELASLGIPDSLDHADLHENQIFHGSRYTFFDWGDAAVSHPFCSLLVPIERVADQLGPDHVPRLREAYLEHWPGDGRTLRRAADLACRLGTFGRATAWQRLFPGNAAIRDAGIAEALGKLV